jgi:hypothetical protein
MESDESEEPERPAERGGAPREPRRWTRAEWTFAAAVVGGLAALLGVLGTTSDFFRQLGAYLRPDLRIVVRREEARPGPERDAFRLTFSLENAAGEPLHVNALNLLVGYPPGAFRHQVVPTIKVAIQLVKDETNDQPIFSAPEGAPEPPAVQVVPLLREGRLRLDPTEQVDFDVSLDVRRLDSEEGALEYDLARIEGRLCAEYELPGETPRVATYPRQFSITFRGRQTWTQASPGAAVRLQCRDYGGLL